MNTSEEKKTIEELFDALDAIVDQMEDGATSLETSFELYKKGMEILKECRETIDYVEKELEIIAGEDTENELS